MRTVTHRPKGGMCQTCLHCFARNCSNLDFASMPVIGKDKDGVQVVKCSEYQRMEKANDETANA